MAVERQLLMVAAGGSWGQITEQFWPVALVSFLVSLAATPICRRIALARGIVDRPDAFLKPHEKPTPYLGGVAIFLGWLAGILAALLAGETVLGGTLMIGLAVAGFAIMAIGLFDDLRVMPPGIKLFCNIAVGVLILGLGLGDDMVGVVTRVTRAEIGRSLELAYSVPVALFILVGACNATNVIDGLDGLCTGVLGIISAGFFILAVHLAIVYPSAEMSDERIVLALAMLGAAAGFLPYNLNPARIFMGDAGSMLLGLNAAILILMFAEAGMVRWMLGALMVFGLPVGDMLLALARRWRNGKPVMIGDRSHFYDQLSDRGFTVRQVVAISYLLTLAFVLVGVSVILLRTRYAVLAYGLAILAAVVAVWRFDMAGIERDRARGGVPTVPPAGEDKG
jgi:UDP-GlcNAc:undecaprenyl-phosphate GlcNAc-1-phosphate transferase